MTDRLRTGAAWLACLAALVLFAARVVYRSAVNPNTVGFATLYAESRVLLERPRDLRNVYDDSWFQKRVDQSLGGHVQEIARGQPPTMSLMLAPLGWLSPGKARAAWICLSTLLWVAGLAVLVSALRLQRVFGAPPLLWLTALTTGYRPLVENLRRGQGYAALFFLLCLAIWVVLRTPRRRWWLAGLPLALMLLLKSAALWLSLLFVSARRWRVLLGVATTGLAVIGVCWPLIGREAWRAYLKDAVRWVSQPLSYVTAYQTVRSLVGHLLIYDPVWNPGPLANLPALATGLTLGIIGATALLTVRSNRLASPVLAERALTMGMFVSLGVSVAPVAEGYHYVLVFPSVLIAWWWALGTQAAMRSRLVLASCTALLCVPQSVYGAARLQGGVASLLAYPLLYGAFGLWTYFVHTLGKLTDGNMDASASVAPGQLVPRPRSDDSVVSEDARRV